MTETKQPKITFGPPEGYDGKYRDLRCNGESVGVVHKVEQDVFRKWHANVRNPFSGRYFNCYRPTLEDLRTTVAEYMGIAIRQAKAIEDTRIRIAREIDALVPASHRPVRPECIRIDADAHGPECVAHLFATYGHGDTPHAALRDLRDNLQARFGGAS